MKVSYKVAKFEKAVAIQITHVDEGFVKHMTGLSTGYSTSNGMVIKSVSMPEILGDEVYLWGDNWHKNLQPIWRTFNSNVERDVWLLRLNEAFVEWSENWEGFE